MARHSPLPALLASFIIITAAGPALAQQPSPLREPGALLRSGNWNTDIGAYGSPQAFDRLKPKQWPAGGWHSFTFEGHELLGEAIPAPRGEKPAFLKTITALLDGPQVDIMSLATEDGHAELDRMYLRVPGAKLRQGRIPAMVFNNGTPQLRPRLDHRYQLSLQGQDFAFSVRNGHRGRNGEPYGDGAHYTIEYDGQTYLYSLDGFGWDSSIKAIADVDGDGKPDFFIVVGGNNSGLEAVLLSSQAKPGRNPATASLASSGC